MVKPWSHWQDQLGAEGEFYHIWRSTASCSLVVNSKRMYLLHTLEQSQIGIQEFLVDVEPEIDLHLTIMLPAKRFTNTAPDLITLRV